VSRGTFYKYYDSPGDLVRDLAVRLADDLIMTVNRLTQAHDDPALKAGLGLRAVLGLVARCPVLGRFIVRAGWPSSDPSHAFFRLVVPNLDEGLRQGRFRACPRELCQSLLGGLSIGAIHAITSGPVAPDFAEEAAEMALAGLGLPQHEARRIARLAMDLPQPDPGSLLGRVMVAAQL
jgi:AcrR family transcriptional regulator